MKQTKTGILSIVLCLVMLCGMIFITGAADDVVIPEGGYIYDKELNTYFMYTAESWQSVVYETRTTGVAGNPATIKLMADLTITDGTYPQYGPMYSMYIFWGEVILDLNGCVLTFKDPSGNNSIETSIDIEQYASLTVTDSSDTQQGKITAHNSEIFVSDGKLTINGGIFESTGVGSSIERTIVSGYGFTYTVINGGTFKGA